VNLEQAGKQKLLIADDSEMNRAILSDMLDGEYEIIEAENGLEAVRELNRYGDEISLVLLDIVMPQMDGFGVLEEMNRNGWIKTIPVIMISAENASSRIERAFELGISDFISRPFDALIVYRRVVNTLLLYNKQKELMALVMEQMRENERQSGLMVDILSHIVEFRNGESGLHVLRIRQITELLLRRLAQKTDQYSLSEQEIALISLAAALHDIGKIAIPEQILNKPGRLTDEEFEVIKTHAMAGANMLKALPMHQSEPLLATAYEICRWHHERYDGRGYPDGLKGDEIPLSAQVVAVGDVYDALVSRRVYKKAFPHEVAVQMIVTGECGTFNPLLIQCLLDIADSIPKELEGAKRPDQRQARVIAEEMLHRDKTDASDRTLQLLEHERMKYNFFADMSQEIQFEYKVSPPIVTLTAWGANRLGIDEVIMSPHRNQKVIDLMGADHLREFSDMLQSTTPEQPVVKYDCQINLNGEARWTQLIGRATWSSDLPPRYLGAIGKAVDTHDAHVKMSHLENLAFHDGLVGLFNLSYAKQRIQERLDDRVNSKFAVVMFDLDHFKSANDTYGHLFGNEVLIYLADKLRRSIRSGDIAARVGGDEFLVALEYVDSLESIIDRIFHLLIGQYKQFPISLSMGVADTEQIGRDFETLFHAADQALYAAKRGGRGRYCFYDHSMNEMLSVISPIEEKGEAR